LSTTKINIGAVEVTAVSDGTLFIDRDEFFPNVPPDAWIPYRGELNAAGRVMLNMGSFVLRSDGQTILVDTGLGPDPLGLDADCGHLLGELELGAVTPDEVDTVLMTHVHPDHIGWNLTYGATAPSPTFPRARYLVPRADWEANVHETEGLNAGPMDRTRAERQSGSFSRQVAPLEAAGKLDLYEGEHAVTSAITTLPTPGHTPGHMAVLIASQGERALVAGDLVHMPLEVHETSWTTRADMDPARAVASRRQTLDRIERDQSVLMAGHFPAPGFGRLERLAGRRYWRAL